MERHANQYISQQIFNILTAQAVTSDYDQNYLRRAGIDIGETIRLDANDLFMSLAGPVATASVHRSASMTAGAWPRWLSVEIGRPHVIDHQSASLPEPEPGHPSFSGIHLHPL